MKFSVRRYDARTLTWWYSRRDRIDFSPPYQRRGSVWPKETKSFLIDSILNGFDIPKIYLADFSIKSELNKKNKLFAVIDGRQRLETLFEFFEDRFSLADTFEYLPDPKLDLRGSKYSVLQSKHPEIASDFDNYNIDVMSVFTDDQSLINDMFVRLNQNRPLTGAEIRNAMKGAAPPVISALADHYFFRNKAAFSMSRGQDKNSAAKLLMTEFRGSLYSTQRSSLDRFVKTAELAESSDLESAAERVNVILDLMCEIFVARDPLLKSEGNLVVFYWLIRNYGQKYSGETFRATMILFNDTSYEEIQKLSEANTKLMDDFIEYDLFMRSVNHTSSLIGRYKILEKWLFIRGSTQQISLL